MMNSCVTISVIALILAVINVAFWFHICTRINELNETLEATIEALAETSSAQRATLAYLKSLDSKLNKKQHP